MYKAVQCDDGVWMVCTEGDVICYMGQGGEKAKADMVAAALNTLQLNVSSFETERD